jgi:DNA-binding MarR family transcriptional regulator
MAGLTQDEVEKSRIMLGLLESIEQGGGQSQRRLAVDLGVALGLVNAYLKRCISKGLVKVSEIPARRYAYYLTPQGFAEKSRLTVEYLAYSFQFFRQAKTDCAELFAAAGRAGVSRVAFAGKSDLAEIASICAMESGATIVAVIDAHAEAANFLGVPVVADFDRVVGQYDAVMVTDLSTSRETYAALAARIDPDRVIVPRLLRLRMDKAEAAS